LVGAPGRPGDAPAAAPNDEPGTVRAGKRLEDEEAAERLAWATVELCNAVADADNALPTAGRVDVKLEELVCESARASVGNKNAAIPTTQAMGLADPAEGLDRLRYAALTPTSSTRHTHGRNQ